MVQLESGDEGDTDYRYLWGLFANRLIITAICATVYVGIESARPVMVRRLPSPPSGSNAA